jgi:hypothetical protein
VTKKFLSLLFGLLLAAGLSVAIQTPASADANGCDGWAYGSFGGYTIPSGILCHQIRGNGRTISVEYADAASARLCNWRIDYRYYNTSGTVYRVSTGPTHTTCTSDGERYYYPGTLPYYGKACAYVYSNGAYLTKQCHNITA